jgi:hypothetical protein
MFIEIKVHRFPINLLICPPISPPNTAPSGASEPTHDTSNSVRVKSVEFEAAGPDSWGKAGEV